jgi:hypothetical protein
LSLESGFSSPEASFEMSNRENRRPEFRVGKYVDSTEPNEIHDALVSRVGPFDHFSKSVPSITKQEYHPSSGFLGLLEHFFSIT